LLVTMNRQLKDLYTHLAVHATADREHEAAVELLLLVMMADRHISTDEVDEIRAISDDSGWESDTFSFDQYVGQATARVRTALADRTVDKLLDDIDGRVVSSVLRAALFSAARDVAGADHAVDADEETLLAQIAARFD
jgi:uncharacterized tellurite resistance protein B-like protein